MSEKKNLIQRMLAIQTEMATVNKGLEVQIGQGRGYKAVSERDVKDAVKPLEAKHGVYSYAVNSELVDSGILVNEKNGYETKSQFMRVKETYRFVNVDDPNEYIEVSAYGDGIDTGDKAPGKADTYAGKYALMKAYKISTGEDPDKDASPEEGYSQSNQNASEKQINFMRKLYSEEEIGKMLEHYGIQDLSELPKNVVTKYIEARAKK